MRILSYLAVLIVAGLHLGFLMLEMFYWDHEVGRQVFSMTPQLSADTKVLAANQGLYNGFLAAGLIWGLVSQKRDVVFLFLVFVIVAGVFGAATAKPTIFFTQALPALIAFVLSLMARPEQKT